VQYKKRKKPSRLSVPLVCVDKTLKVERSATSLSYVPSFKRRGLRGGVHPIEKRYIFAK
jgi:hypothetical protein